MKKYIFISAVALTLILSSCSITTPLTVSAAPMGTRTGSSKTGVLFGFYTNKNFGIAEAAHNGKITGGVGVADLKVTNNPFGYIYHKKEIIVYGN